MYNEGLRSQYPTGVNYGPGFKVHIFHGPNDQVLNPVQRLISAKISEYDVFLLNIMLRLTDTSLIHGFESRRDPT